jgi:hypothetical protein
MAYNPTDENLKDMVHAIEKAEPLLEQNLLKKEELQTLTNQADGLYEAAADHNSIQYRKYDMTRRSTTIWSPESRGGYVGKAHAGRLLILKRQIIELLNLHSVEIEPNETEVFIAPGTPYESRVALRNVLSRATTSIDIKDDYLLSANKTTKNIELLAILYPYLEAPLSIKARLLGSSDQLPLNVKSDVSAFCRQFSQAEIKGYSHSNDEGVRTRETHGRFIIIDGQEVFKIDSSIKDLGATQSSIDKVGDELVDKYKDIFEEWWNKAVIYDLSTDLTP